MSTNAYEIDDTAELVSDRIDSYGISTDTSGQLNSKARKNKSKHYRLKRVLCALFALILLVAIIVIVFSLVKTLLSQQRYSRQKKQLGNNSVNGLNSKQNNGGNVANNTANGMPGVVRLDTLQMNSAVGDGNLMLLESTNESSTTLTNDALDDSLALDTKCYGYMDQNGECLFQSFSSCQRDSRTVALTFDDGPSTDPEATSSLLDELDSLMLPATFFSTPAANGESPDDLYARCKLIGEIMTRRKVHHSVQAHSWDHPDFTTLDRPEFDRQMSKTIEFLEACSALPTQFRPPFGKLTDQQAEILKSISITIAMWNMELPGDAPRDDVQAQFELLIEQFESKVGLGHSAVILLHDSTYFNSHGLVTLLAKYFRDRQYQFITTDECYLRCSLDGPICKDTGTPIPFPGVFVP